MLWRSKGSPHYLLGQSARLGVPEALVKECQHVRHVFQVFNVLGQLCERYHKARKEGAVAILHAAERRQVEAALRQAERECDKLHVSAAATAAGLDDAWRAFGFDPPDRRYAILSDHDPVAAPFVLPLGDGTAGEIGPGPGTDSEPVPASHGPLHPHVAKVK